MKKTIIIASIIFIVFIASAFILKTDVPVSVYSEEDNNLSLNNKAYIFKIRSKEGFNSISVRVLTFTKLIHGKTVTFKIKESLNGRTLAFGSISEGWPHAEFYKFSFKPLKANKTYFLEIKGPRGVPYKVTQSAKGQLLHKLYKRKPLAYIAYNASLRAANDWFRFGSLYLSSILIFVGLISFLLASLITKFGIETDI